MYKMYLQKSTFLFCNYVHFMLAKNSFVLVGSELHDVEIVDYH